MGNGERGANVDSERVRLAAVVEAMPIGVVIVGPGDEAAALNAEGARLLAATEAAASFRRASGIEYAFDELPTRRALDRGERVIGERVVVQTADGERLMIAVDAVPFAPEAIGPRQALAFLTDVTDTERRERADREFVSNAAHQLRTPLAAIASVVAALQGGAKDDPAERDRFLAHLERETDRLARLGRAMLVLARAQRGEEQAHRAVVALRPVIEAIVGDVVTSEAVRIELECDPSVGALANPDLLEEAISNLVTNAVSHTERGTVSIRAAIVDGTTTVEIRDTGSGISREDQPRVFERFYSSPEGPRGFGLGLAIARTAVEAAGGTITLVSEKGVGTTVSIALPSARVVA